MGFHGAMQHVVRRPRQANGLRRIEILRGRFDMRDDLHGDADVVHFAHAQIAQISQPPGMLGIGEDIEAAAQFAQFGRPEVLFNRNRAHGHRAHGHRAVLSIPHCAADAAARRMALLVPIAPAFLKSKRICTGV
jgi:hypothetical protein